MKKNVGTIDIVMRLLIAALLIILNFTNVITGPLAIIIWIFAGILILTSILSFCPIWYLVSFNTRKKE
jgi:hypothetical protein